MCYFQVSNYADSCGVGCTVHGFSRLPFLILQTVFAKSLCLWVFGGVDTTEWLFPLSGSSDWSGVRRLSVKTVSEFGLEDTPLPFFKFL